LFQVSTETRYYYVDPQNQAAGPVPFSGLLALKAAGTITDATLVVIEGGTEWTAFSTLKPASAPAAASSSSPSPSAGQTSPSFSSATMDEPTWASQLSQKIDLLTAAMDKLAAVLEKTRSASTTPVIAPATAALHAEKVNLNQTPKPGIAALNPALAAAVPRPGVSSPLAPLAVPANAQKSSLPLPALGKTPGPAPTATPTDPTGKGNIFSKFLKK